MVILQKKSLQNLGWGGEEEGYIKSGQGSGGYDNKKKGRGEGGYTLLFFPPENEKCP